MKRLLAVAFAPAPGRRASAAQQALAVLGVERWAPPGVELLFLTAPWSWWTGTDLVLEAADAADAVLLLSAAPGDIAEVADLALNAADGQRDGLGLAWAGRILAPGGPDHLEATLPAAGLTRALNAAGLATTLRGTCGAGPDNRCLYALLDAAPERPAGLIRLPTSLEAARAEHLPETGPSRLTILAGVQTALSACADLLADDAPEAATAT